MDKMRELVLGVPRLQVLCLLGCLLLLLPLHLSAQAEDLRFPAPLHLVYECDQAQSLGALLDQAQWRLGATASPVLPAATSLAMKPQSANSLCAVQLQLPQSIAQHRGQQSLSLALPEFSGLVSDSYPFAGLAKFYNSSAQFYLRHDGRVEYTDALPDSLALQDWWGWKGRYRIAVLSAPGATVLESAGTLELRWPVAAPVSLVIYLGKPGVIHDSGVIPASGFDEVRYSHLWAWLGGLSRLVEWSLVSLNAALGVGWGIAILLLAVLVKLLLLPASMLTLRLQQDVSRYQSQLEPQLSRIKAECDGEDAHKRIMAAHSDLGITPFYTLKPLFASLIQIPFLVAIFNALGEMPQLQGADFLWIANLAYPDAVAPLPFDIPFFGDTLNLLPFVMTVVTLIATLCFSNAHAPAQELRRQKRNLLVMSVVFFVLFYPFPAAMVWYWTVANALQLLQQRLVRID